MAFLHQHRAGCPGAHPCRSVRSNAMLSRPTDERTIHGAVHAHQIDTSPPTMNRSSPPSAWEPGAMR